MLNNNVARPCYDEDAEMADDYSHDEKLWAVRRCEPNWCLFWPTVDAAFQALSHRPEMARLVEEIDSDNAEFARLDCSDLGATLADIVSPDEVWLLPRQAGDRR